MRDPAIIPGPEPDRPIGTVPGCPLGLRQATRACLGCYEREPGRLQLRFAAQDDEGVCAALVQESEDAVTVRVVLCASDDPGHRLRNAGYAEERHHVQLRAPLHSRPVIDYETGGRVPFYVPTWWHNRRLSAPGFHLDAEEARAAWQPIDDDDGKEQPRHNAPLRLRTLGY